MAEQIISPGAFTRENDQSFLQEGVAQIGAAIIGPTAKGPALSPTIVTTISQFENIFGTTIQSGSNYYTYLTNLTARSYFENGGNSMLVVRVLSGSYTPATSTINVWSQSLSQTGSTSCFVLETLSVGDIMNNAGTEVSGALVSGSADNVRWQIGAVNTGSGTFTLFIRRGNDNNRTPAYLETWNNLSLDPNSPNFISYVIGDQTRTTMTDSNGSVYVQVTGSYPNQSRYVRIKSVTTLTPDYLDVNGNIRVSAYTASLPANVSGAFSNGSNGIVLHPQNFYENINNTNSQGYGVEPGSSGPYNQAINLLSNADEFDFNLLFLPGLAAQNGNHLPIINSAIDMVSNRGDAMVVLDLMNYGTQNLSQVVSNATSFNTSYAATYWPWVQFRNPYLGGYVWAPASVALAGAIAQNDKIGAEWFAPAGLNRGGLPTVIRPERKIPLADRNTLYAVNVNPLATFPGAGTVVYGQKTLQKSASALDRVNVRRLLISLKKFIASISRYLVFEQNTNVTRNKFLSIVNPYLESVQQRQGLYAFKVIMDDSNNTSDIIDRQQLVGQIYLQPTRTVEYIILDFNLQPTGATFS
jgi:phage tail sheath protein FI